jgi:dihydroorotate dehydrogenase
LVEIAKISPITVPKLRKQVITALSYDCDAINVTNTLPNSRGLTSDGNLAIKAYNDSSSELITVGGAAGAALRTISLTMASEARDCLSQNISVIRTGGISSGKDLRDTERLSDKVCGVATALIENGPKIFTKLREEYSDCI